MSLIFVGGSPRSGTTLLQSILCTDATTNPLIEECSYLRHLVAGYAFGRDVFPYQTKDYFDSPEDLRRFAAEGLQRLVEGLAARFPEARDLVLKEPLLTPHLPALKELLPQARLVISLRDPRDAIASMVRVQARHFREKRDSELARIGRDAGALARYWRSFYDPLIACQDPAFVADTLIVPHEELVASPQPMVASLRSFTGLELAGFDPERPWEHSSIDFSSDYKKSHSWNSPLYGQGLSAARQGAWRETLTAPEVRTIERECRDLIQLFGYGRTAAA